VISERSYMYVIILLGISKAGGVFLPIDSEYPEYMIEEVKTWNINNLFNLNNDKEHYEFYITK